jgi:hypothetical protein
VRYRCIDHGGCSRRCGRSALARRVLR